MAQLIPDNARSREDIPAAVRRLATGLKLALDDDAIVWYQPLFDDPTGQPRFVVLLPDNGIAVLEVFDVCRAQVLGVLRSRIRVEQNGREQEMDSPLAVADCLAAELRQRVAAEHRLAHLKIPVQGAAVFTALEREHVEELGLTALPGFEVERCLFRADVDAAVAARDDLHRLLARLLGAADPVSGPLLDVVRGIVAPEIVFGVGNQLPIFRSPEGEELVRVMDLRQERLAKSLGGGHRVIRGVAGSGKTVILVCRAKLFAEHYPDRKFLLTCYTNTLAGQLGVFLADHPNVEVRTLDSLITKAIADAELEAPPYGDDGGETRAEVGLEALERGALPRYRAVLIDEAQDFGTARLRFAVSLADERFNDVLIVADNAQKVFKRDVSWKEAGVQAQGRTRILRRNYRNTREILEFAHGLLSDAARDGETPDLDDENLIVQPEAALRAGPLPSLHIRDGDVVERAAAAVKRLLEQRRGAKDVAVLCVSTSEAQAVGRSLQRADIEFFDVTGNVGSPNRKRIGSATQAVVLSTIHSAKGLEFPAVVLCGTPRAEMAIDELRNVLYVGMTRATEHLEVVVDQRHPLVDELRRSAEPSARIALVEPDAA
jgi:hypothetical protein